MKYFKYVVLAFVLFLTSCSTDEQAVEKDVPVLEYDVTNVEYRAFDVEYTVSDFDQTFQSIRIAVFNGGVQLLGLNSSDLTGTYTIDELNTDCDYLVQVTVVYDLDDSQGNQSLIESTTIHTLEHQVPVLDIEVVDEYIDHALLQIYVDDPDGVLLDASLHVKDGEEIIQTHSVTQEELMIINGLLSSHEYTFELVHHYDLDDGMHEIEVIQIKEATTPTAQAPTFTMNGFRSDTSTIYIAYEIEDPSMIAQEVFTATLYNKTEQIVQTIEVNRTTDEEIIFTDLNYEIVMYDFDIVLEYNLNDGLGEQIYTYYYVDVFTNYIDIVSLDQNYTTITPGEEIVVEMIINNPFNLELMTILFDTGDSAILSEIVTNVYYFDIRTTFLPLGENIIVIDAVIFNDMGYSVTLLINVNNEITFTIVEDPTS